MNLHPDGRLELIISGCTKRDAGTYSCLASNEVGSAEASAAVEIIPKSVDDGTEAATVFTKSQISRDIP